MVKLVINEYRGGIYIWGKRCGELICRKKLSLVFLLSLFVTSAALAQQKPELDFERTEHNFGTIKEELGAVTTQFEFTNTGKSPLIIQRVSASCGCTTPWAKPTRPSPKP